MTAHLLLITLGPVQDFIAQARRTRDLWHGSHLLSELGRAAARILVAEGAELVFPALELGHSELEACPAPLRSNGKSPLNIPNKLLAVVPSGTDPAALARQVREGVFEYWCKDLAGPVKNKCAGLIAEGTHDVWDEQVRTLLEFAASWASLDDYSGTRTQVEQAVAARKALRDFDPWLQGRGAVPKSSLDGARETVLLPPKARDPIQVRKYRIATGEQLDAVGLVKRAGGEPEQFVPVVNVALASWMKLAVEIAGAELSTLMGACGKIRVPRVARPDLPCAKSFPYDASVFIESRWETLFKEAVERPEGDPAAWGKSYVRPVTSKLSAPYPYVACLVADGDHMGRAISRLDTREDHRNLSEALSEFAAEARDIVEQQSFGSLVYSGGDDVLAFVPLPEALSCAQELRESFKCVMAKACRRLKVAKRPTLSVGLGIGHIMDGMGDLLELGRSAEREAKRERNALAVIVDKRSGGRWTWMAQWDADPVGQLSDAVTLLGETLSLRKVYEIATTLRRLPRPPFAEDRALAEDNKWARLLSLEVARSLSRVDSEGLSPGDVGLSIDGIEQYANVHGRVAKWVDRMLIARTFAQASPQPRADSVDKEAVA